jgi:hypothetical protein
MDIFILLSIIILLCLAVLCILSIIREMQRINTELYKTVSHLHEITAQHSKIILDNFSPQVIDFNSRGN